MGEDKHLTVSEAARQLGTSEKTIRRWLASRRLRAEKVDGPYGPAYQIAPADLEQARRTVTLPTVVKMEAPTVTAIADAMQERMAPIVDELHALREEVAALRAQLEPTPARPRPWWQVWNR